MWNVIKNAVTQLTETLGIEIPGLPVEVGSVAASITETATTAAQAVTESATGAVETLTATAGEAVTAASSDLTDTVAGINDAAR